MPKIKAKTEKNRIATLTKTYLECGCNQAAVGRKFGVNRATINARINKKPVQDALRKYLNSAKLRKELREVAKEGLKANKVIGYLHQYKKNEEGKIEKIEPDESVSNDFVEVPDFNARHKFWRDLATMIGELKQNGNGHNITVSIHLTTEERNARINRLRVFHAKQS